MLRLWAMTLALACSGPICLPVSASERSPAPNELSSLEQLRAQDSYLHRVGWRLLTGNARFCSKTQINIGLLLQDAANYPDPAAVRSSNRLNGDIFVQSVVEGGPAQMAGISAGDEIVEIGGTSLASFALSPTEKWRRLIAIDRFLGASLAANKTVAVSLGDAPLPREITGIAACAGRFELLTGQDVASANAERVAIGTKFIGLTYPEEEFAAVLAHELAHIVLAHPQWLDAKGRKRRNIRDTEREADRLMPWLLANAGYSPQAAMRFMENWGPHHSGGLFRKRTHDGWDERVEQIQGELPLIQAALSAHGAADWSGRFTVRNTDS